MFSLKYKHNNYEILGHRHIRLAIADGNYQMALVEPNMEPNMEPNINQMENNYTLNFYVLYLTPV